MDERTKEAVRYLGFGKHAVDDQTFVLISDSFRELDSVADKRIIYRIFNLIHKDSSTLYIGKMKISSRHLKKNLMGCEQAVLMGGTLGISVDMLMKRYSLTDMAKAVVLQACAAALLEEYLDDCQKSIDADVKEQGFSLRPRFSPGYGDFSISHQAEMIRMLDSAKTIGLTLTEGGMLTPTKSVTAVIGMSKEKQPCHKRGCEDCGYTKCTYRR